MRIFRTYRAFCAKNGVKLRVCSDSAELDGENMDYNCVFLAVYSISREEVEFCILGEFAE
jgi:hypothetical protein